MSYTCLSSAQGSIPSAPAAFMAARERPRLLQGTPSSLGFAVGGSGYNMLQNFDFPIVWVFFTDMGMTAVKNMPWDYLRVEFSDDLDFTGTAIVAAWNFPVVNAGEEDEHFAGTMPATEINKLESETWHMARLITSSNTRLAHCPFYVLGGV